MRIVYINKIQYFVVISVFFHLLIFVTVSSFVKLNKDYQKLEIFIINDVTKSFKGDVKTSVPLTKKTVEKIPFTVKSDENIKIENQKTETITNYSSSNVETSQKISSNKIASNLKSDKDGIIDTEFGTAYGPKFIHREIPIYPQIARRLGKEGKVTLRLTLNEKGELMHIEIIEGAPYGFTESAIEAVKKSKFSPAIKDGKPVACRAILPVRFILKN
ncbi:energy transducer TonB [Thermodesulfovibrio yellowstonii]|uniref:TonB domain protein, putative n=1 Tax=Thermodesulfovibrio yellowstonii (strain ATCC 51303 / DSM 11347 / YP87) TaxID=289376 RepID=B5YHG7_THEYD|nr:energy transducer TonB [Thermodesulfovibrio yellowstonii]ACI20429.1 TonB domain protein, putative [Thermodesulfovibrio yellowstonii DSM 11347]